MIRLGLVGCGNIGGTHTRSYNDQGGELSVAATVDIDAAKASEAAKVLGAGKSATDFHDILDDVDAVLLSLPHHLHHPVGMECIAAGKHVLMEKPLANTEAQCLELIDAADRAGRVLMVAYPWPHNPMNKAMKQLIDDRTYGDVFHISLWTEQQTEPAPGHWMLDPAKLGGGQLFSHGCHYIDLLLRYLGAPIEGTHIGTNYGTPWMEREGTSDVSIKFESGAVGYHFGTWGAKGTRLGYSFHAHCTEGMLEMRMVGGRMTLSVHQDKDEKILMEETPSDLHLECEMQHFVECIKTGGRPLTDGRRSLQSLRVIWRLYEAEREHKVADLRGLGLDQA